MARPWRWALLGAALLAFQVSIRAELILADYSASKPVKIMAIGDSITDDCSINGAWRFYLQPLLETNGYPFRFVGRQASTPVRSFTKVNHEGYCGAVIAPPGVFAVHGYSTTDAYLLRIVADALAVTNNRPDVVLLLIGANDIGRGRDPYHVATNDMPQLLDLIFTNVPAAQVVLAKITSLQSANISGLSYGSYAPNVPIYNAALQVMVNQRRAAGQNVFLADMFSAVDYQTMFMADHVHPNAVGLRAMANEWLSRIQSLTVRTDQISAAVIHGGDLWKYSDTGQDLGTNWAQPNYDDSPWSSGYARLGYGDPTTVTAVDFGPDPNRKYVTTYFRKAFVLPWNTGPTNVNLRLARADGAAVWLNGQEVYRTNLPTGQISAATLALKPMTPFTSPVFYPVNLPLQLPAGTNVVGVEIHQSSTTNSVLGFDMELTVSSGLIPNPSLSISPAQGNMLLTWPLTSGSGFSLYSTPTLNSNVGWSKATEAAYTNGGQIVVTQATGAGTRFFRLQQP